MKPFRLMLAALVMTGLAGCYSSETPLIEEADSVAPFSKITFMADNDDPAAFTREGNHFFMQDGQEITTLHLKPVENNDYVAQLKGEKPGELLYGYLRIDTEAKKASLWGNVAPMEDEDIPADMKPCSSGSGLCIESIDSYLAHVRPMLSEDPETVFDITFEE